MTEIKPPAWNTIDSEVRKMAERAVITSDPGIREAFLTEYETNASIYRKEIQTLFSSLSTQRFLKSPDPLRDAIHSIISNFCDKLKRKNLYDGYDEFMQSKNVVPDQIVSQEEFFKVHHPPQSGTRSWKPQYRRHASPATRMGILSKRERSYKECRSIHYNWEHILKEKIEIGCFVSNPYTHQLSSFWASKRRQEEPEQEIYRVIGITPEAGLILKKGNKVIEDSDTIEYSVCEQSVPRFSRGQYTRRR